MKNKPDDQQKDNLTFKEVWLLGIAEPVIKVCEEKRQFKITGGKGNKDHGGKKQDS